MDLDPNISGIQRVDASDAQGWQGRLRFEYVVGNQVLSQNVDVQAGSTPINASALDRPGLLRAVQQRLNYLGFDGGLGSPLPITGNEDAATINALAQFKAAIDSSGEQTPAGEMPTDANPLLDNRTWRWLNSDNAPSWIKLPSVQNAGRPYVTDWVLELMQMAGKDPTLPQNHNLVVTASGTPAISALAPIEYRSSQAGMGVV